MPYTNKTTCDTWYPDAVNLSGWMSSLSHKCIPARKGIPCEYYNSPIAIYPMWGSPNEAWEFGGMLFDNVSISYDGSMPIVVARAFGEEEGLGHISGSIHAVVSNQSACRLDLDAPSTHKEKMDLALTCSQAQ